jgi:hypothetical protein
LARAVWTFWKIASVSGIFFGSGLENPTQPVTVAVEQFAHCLTARHGIFQLGHGLQSIANRLGCDPGKREGGLKLGIGLGLGFDQTMDVVDEFRAEFFGLFASTQFISVQATDAGSELVEPGVDRVTSPAEDQLCLAGGSVAVLESRFRLESSTLVTGKQLCRRLDRLNDIFRECCHGRLLLERRH